MKISELISLLESKKAESGDLRVKVENGLDPSDFDDVTNVQTVQEGNEMTVRITSI